MDFKLSIPLELLILHILVHSSFKQTVDFYDFFFVNDLPINAYIYVLTAVRRLNKAQ